MEAMMTLKQQRLVTQKIMNRKNGLSLLMSCFWIPAIKINAEEIKKNRSKHKYPSYHGSQSYAQNQYMGEKKTGSSNYFDVFKRTHSKDRNWANEACKADWEKIQAELARSSRDADSSSLAIDDIGVLERALGHMHGHIRGVGRVVRTVTPEISGTYPSSQQQQQLQEMQKEMEQMRQEVQEMRQQQQQVPLFSNQALMELLHQQNQQHEFQMKQMTLEFQCQINELKTQLPQHDEDDEDDN